MKWLLIICTICQLSVQAQQKKLLKVEDVNHFAIIGASVYGCRDKDTIILAVTNSNGFANVSTNYTNYKITGIGFITQISNEQIITLKNKNYNLETVAINAVRVNNKAPITSTIIKNAELKKINIGQDIPIILNNTPSIVTTSDAGTGIGYTGLRIRGSDITRINFTVNGVILNEAESHATFFVNMPDFLSSVNSIQVQRGVGTSTNGAGSFGANVNLETCLLETNHYLELNNGYGSFNTIKNTIKIGTGLIKKSNISIDARLSNLLSDGYIDRASSDLKAYFVQAGYYGAKTTFKFITFGGKEKTYQAWNGVPENELKKNRTFNEFTYQNQTDNYQQLHYQTILSHQINNKNIISLTYHRTDGKGYYEEFKQNQDLINYGINPIIQNKDTLITTDLVRRKWLDNTLNGIISSWNYKNKQWDITSGLGFNVYAGKHFGKIVSTSINFVPDENYTYYNNDALKTDFNLFSKINYAVTNKVNAFAEMQYRQVNYNFLGFETDASQGIQKVKLPFYNPKVGVTIQCNNNHFVYGSFGVANKEPNRDDFVNTSINSRAQAEQLQNIELGHKYSKNKWSTEVVLYNMLYENQLVNNGAINDVGAYTRINVSKSYRRGVELSFTYNPIKKLIINSNVAFSKNKIPVFNEYVFNYDNFTDSLFTYNNTDISFSPNIIAAATITFLPIKHLSIDWANKYVGKQYLDNSQSELRKLNPFYTSNLMINYTFEKIKIFKTIQLSLAINNIFNALYEPNGYTFGDISSSLRNSYNYYYPQAGTNYMFNLNLRF